MPHPGGRQKELTPKQKRFVFEYLIDLNATQAAIRTGYKNTKAVEVAAHHLLRNPKIQAAIAAAQEAQAKKRELTPEKILNELTKIGFSDVRKLFNADGSLKNVSELDDDAAAAIASIEIDEITEGRGEDKQTIGYTRKVRVWDKGKALVNLGKHLGMFPDRVEHSGKLTVEHTLTDVLTQINKGKQTDGESSDTEKTS